MDALAKRKTGAYQWFRQHSRDGREIREKDFEDAV